MTEHLDHSEIEAALRKGNERAEKARDPGDLFWARLPDEIFGAYQAAQRRRRLRLLLVPAALLAAALLLVVLSPARHPGAGAGAGVLPGILMQAPGVAPEEQIEAMDRPALLRLLHELDGYAIGEVAGEAADEDAPVDELIDHLPEKALRDLAHGLHKG